MVVGEIIDVEGEASLIRAIFSRLLEEPGDNNCEPERVAADVVVGAGAGDWLLLDSFTGEKAAALLDAAGKLSKELGFSRRGVASGVEVAVTEMNPPEGSAGSGRECKDSAIWL